MTRFRDTIKWCVTNRTTTIGYINDEYNEISVNTLNKCVSSINRGRLIIAHGHYGAYVNAAKTLSELVRRSVPKYTIAGEIKIESGSIRFLNGPKYKISSFKQE